VLEDEALEFFCASTGVCAPMAGRFRLGLIFLITFTYSYSVILFWRFTCFLSALGIDFWRLSIPIPQYLVLS
jgi:hypothetical protein